MSAQRIVEKENFRKITEQYILSGVKRSVPDRHSSSSEKDGFPHFDDPLKGGTKPDGDVSPTGTLLPPEGSEDIFSGILPEEYSEFLTSLTTGNTDDGSMAKINDLFSNSDALQMLGNIGGISDLSLSSEAGSRLFGEMGGLFDVFAKIGDIVSFVSEKTGAVGLLLNMVDAGNLFTKTDLASVLNDERLSGYSDLIKKGDTEITAFMKTKLSSDIILELSFIYYDYLADESSADGWKDKLSVSIGNIVNERKNDLGILIGREPTESEADFTADFASVLSSRIIENTVAPEEKTSSLSPVTKAFLKSMFSVRMVISNFIIALVLALMYMILSNNKLRSTTMFVGIEMTLCALCLYLLSRMNEYIVGGFFDPDAPGVLSANVFFTNAIVFGSIGIAFMIFVIAYKIVLDVRQKQKYKLDTSLPEGVLTAGEIEVMSMLGMNNFLKNDNKQNRHDGLVDYYGDGRGLEFQRQFAIRQKENEQTRKEEQEKRASADGEFNELTRIRYIPTDGGTDANDHAGAPSDPNEMKVAEETAAMSVTGAEKAGENTENGKND